MRPRCEYTRPNPPPMPPESLHDLTPPPPNGADADGDARSTHSPVAPRSPEAARVLRRAEALTAPLAALARASDRARFPEAEFALVREAGLLAAPIPARSEDQG